MSSRIAFLSISAILLATATLIFTGCPHPHPPPPPGPDTNKVMITRIDGLPPLQANSHYTLHLDSNQHLIAYWVDKFGAGWAVRDPLCYSPATQLGWDSTTCGAGTGLGITYEPSCARTLWTPPPGPATQTLSVNIDPTYHLSNGESLELQLFNTTTGAALPAPAPILGGATTTTSSGTLDATLMKVNIVPIIRVAGVCYALDTITWTGSQTGQVPPWSWRCSWQRDPNPTGTMQPIMITITVN